ncbi:MAG: CHAD domain-containing protein [Anaerolineales bacterium]|jgi:CHAD domain-containing protein
MDENSSQFPQPIDTTPGLQPDDPIAEAGRKILKHQYRMIRLFEQGVRAKEDIEALHKMRVAVRRMRIAYRVFRNYISREIIRPSIKELRELGDALGDVRDLDVFLINAGNYKSNLIGEKQIVFSLIEGTFESKRKYHRRILLELLNGQTYQGLCERLSEMLARSHGLVKDGKEQTTSSRTDVAAREIIRKRYEKILDFDRFSEKETIEKLHRIRIAVKAFRYSIEFFEEVLGNDARYVIEKLITLQDFLGELNDRAVAVKMMEKNLLRSDFLDGHSDQVNSLATSYLESLGDDVKMRIEGFPSVWEIVHQSTFTSYIGKLFLL